jgi:hypothetical protein
MFKNIPFFMITPIDRLCARVCILLTYGKHLHDRIILTGSFTFLVWNRHFNKNWVNSTLEKTVGEIKNGKSRETGNFWVHKAHDEGYKNQNPKRLIT